MRDGNHHKIHQEVKEIHLTSQSIFGRTLAAFYVLWPETLELVTLSEIAAGFY